MRYKVNISIDDISPHPKSSVSVFKRCIELIREFPKIKFTIFIPVAYWRTVPDSGHTATTKPLNILEYPEFCSILKKIPKENFEIGYHGYYHGIPSKSNNDEFQYLSKKQAIEKFNLMFSTVEKAGLKDIFKPIFRPPAWRMSPEAIEAAKEVGIEILTLSSKDYAKETYKGAEETCDVVYYNCNPPFDPLKLYEKTEIVYHACEWDKNYLDKEKTKELSEFLKNDNIEFCFMKELI